ncbi:hypothetical protein WA158_001018 [Blastocystis sp. Blastoise]
MGVSITQTCANMVKTCVGAGILALPNTFYGAGLVPSLIILIVVTLWSGFCTKRLVSCMTSTLEGVLGNIFDDNNDPYFHLVRKALGKFGVVLLNICYVVTLYGIATAYQITWTNLLIHMDWEKIGFSLGSERWFWCIIYFIIVLPLSYLRNLDSLGFVSLFGNIVIGVSSILVLVYGGIHWGFHWDNSLLWYKNPMDMAVIFGVFCYALCIIFIGPTSKKTLNNGNKFDFCLWISLLICFALYSVLGGFGAIFFKEDPNGIDAIVLDNMTDSPIFYYITAIGLCMSCLASYPIAVYPAALAVESWITDTLDKPENKTFVRNWKRIVMRTCMLAVVTILAFVFPDFKKVIGLIGCLTVSTVQFILPPLVHYRLSPSNTWSTILDISLTVIGVLVMVFTTYCTIVTSN